MTYIVKCDNCKADMRETDSIRESAAGGRCVPCTAIDQIATARRIEDKLPMFLKDASAPNTLRTHSKTRGLVRNAVVEYVARLDLYNVTVHTFRSSNVDSLKSETRVALYADQMAAFVLGRTV